MKADTALFELIRAMDPAEIKHFRKLARRHPNNGTNNYLRLFDALAGAEAYDETAVKSLFEGEGLEKNFANVKRYLFRQLLGFLAGRQAETDPRAILEARLAEAEVLWQRGLYRPSVKCFERAATQAREQGFFELEIRALGMVQRERIARRSKNGMEQVEALEEQIAVAMRRFREWNDLLLVHRKIFLLFRSFYANAGPGVLARLDGFMRHPLLRRDPDTIDFFEGRRLWLNCHAAHAQLQGDRQGYARLQKRIIEAWEQFPAMQDLHPNRYRLDLANLLAAGGQIGDYSGFPEMLARLHAIPAQSRDEEGEVFQNTAFFELLFMMNSGRFEEARHRLPAIERGLSEFVHKVNPARLLAFRYNMMVLYFVLEDYRAALTQLNLILHDEGTGHRQDIQQVARIFLLIFHFELGNADLLEYLFRSAYRYLYARGGLGRFERAILGFLRKSAGIPAGDSLLPAFGELRGELQAILADPVQGRPAGIEEIIYWLRSKLEKRPITELIAPP